MENLLPYDPELDPNNPLYNPTKAAGYGMVNRGLPATQPVAYGKPKAAEPGKKRKMNPWTMAGLGLLGGIWAQHNPQGFHAAMGAMGQGLQRQQEMELKREQERLKEEQYKREAKRWEDDRISRENIAKGVANTRTKSAADTAFGRLTTAFNTAYRVDPEGAIRAYGPALAQAASEAGLPWPSSMTTTPGILGTGAKVGADVERDKTKEMLDWAKQFGVGPDGTLNPGVPPAVPAVGSKAWLDTQTGMGKAADTAYTQGPKTRNTEARTANTQAQTAYTQGPRTALTTAQANRVTTLLPSELELKLAQIEKLLSAPAPRGTGGGRTPSPPRPKPKPTTMTEREAARLAAAYPGQPPKVAKKMDQEGFAKGLPFEVSLATEGYWTEDKRTAYPTQFKYDQDALEIINASVASGVSKAQTMKRLADAGLLVKTLIGPGTQATARQNYEKIYDWIMKANGKTAPIPNFSKGGPFSPEDDMRKLAEQRVNGL